MPTFPKGASSHGLFVQHAKLLAQLARETGGNVAEERAKLRMQHTASDWKTLRGLPAIGRGVSGAVAGSDPVRSLLAKESRRS